MRDANQMRDPIHFSPSKFSIDGQPSRNRAEMQSKIVVLGAGMVGVSCALELQARGAQVTLIDRREPGRETSYGNAGVVARGSLLPFNNPMLWSALPTLLRNRSGQLRYAPAFLARHPRWLAGFLASTRPAVFTQTTAALDALIRLSRGLHRDWSAAAGASAHWRDNGWLYLYRQAAAFEAGAWSRSVLARYGVAMQELDAAALRELEPALQPIFARALWIQDAASADDPGGVTQAYARLFVARGGRLLQQTISQARPMPGGWCVDGPDGRVAEAEQLVVALGPWSADFLRPLGLRVPLAYERGYHLHFDSAEGSPALRRPVYDTAGAYVLAPMAQGLRLSTGVELTARDAPDNLAQLQLAERAARQALALGARVESQPWRGARPTLPDSRPMIGAAPRHAGLWLAFGHQHIGFSTGPATGRLLAALVTGQPPDIDVRPFAPQRFRL